MSVVTPHIDAARTTPPPPPAAKAPRALILALCALAATLGSVRLGVKPLWHDEAFSDAVVRLPLMSMWHVVTRGDFFNGLYYGLLHFWQWGGDSEVWLRLPSVAFGVMATFALFALNRRLFGLRIALLASALLAVNSYFVQYQQEARPYSLAIFVAVMATYLFVLALDRPSTWRWIAYGVVCAFAVYAHLFAVFVIGAHFASLTFRRPRPRLRHLAAACGVTGVLVAPLIVVMLATDPLQRYFIERPTLGSFQSLFLNLTGAGSVPTREGHLLLLAYLLVCAVAVFFMGKAVIRQPVGNLRQATWPHALILLWLALPILVSFAVSIAMPIFLPRYLIVVLPPLVTVAAIGISSLPSRSLRAVVLVGLIALSIPPLRSYYQAGFKEGQDWRSAANYVVQTEHPGDGVVFLIRYGRRPFEYYLIRSARSGTAALQPVYPGVHWGGYTPVLADLSIESTRTAVARIRNGYDRIWVILLWRGFQSVNEDARPIKSILEDDYQEMAERSFGPALHVVLYERISP